MPERHFTTASFWEQYAQLPLEIRALADRCYELIKEDPNHPSLRFKKVGDLYSARVGLRHRALATKEPDGFVWFWIGPHSEYDRRLR
jgi:hypothetical protein